MVLVYLHCSKILLLQFPPLNNCNIMLKPICNQTQTLHSYNPHVFNQQFQHSIHRNNFNTQQKFNTSNAFTDCLDNVIRSTSSDTFSQQIYASDNTQYHDNNNLNLDNSYYGNNQCTICNFNCCSNIPNELNYHKHFSDQQSIFNAPTIHKSSNTSYTTPNVHQYTNVHQNITIETLLNTLEKGVNNNDNALLFAKMVSIIINKHSNTKNIQQIIKRLIDENIINVLTNLMMSYAKYPTILMECQLALNQLATCAVNNKPTENNAENTNSNA
eukprot:244302_1